MPCDQAAAIAEAQKDAFSEAMDTQLICKSDWMEMENRLIKWSAGFGIRTSSGYRSTGKVTLRLSYLDFVFKLLNPLFLH